MPLIDLFQPPYSSRKGWEGFHSTWAVTMVMELNARVLPKPFEAEPHVHLSRPIEIDVATMEPDDHANGFGGHGGVATLPRARVGPTGLLSAAVDISEIDTFEVLIYRDADRWRLKAAVELVSPSNKDRPETRQAFAMKCLRYLAAGVSVVVVDVVTERLANLHTELVRLGSMPTTLAWESPSDLTAISYRTRQVNDDVILDVWPQSLVIGQELPTLPLWLAVDYSVPLDLESTFQAARQILRLN